MTYLCAMMTAKEIIRYMESLRNEEQRQVLMRFFKTGPGEYGEGDEFLGLKVPQTREVVKLTAGDTPLDEVPELLMSRWHEVRLCGLLILVARFEKLAKKRLHILGLKLRMSAMQKKMKSLVIRAKRNTDRVHSKNRGNP